MYSHLQEIYSAIYTATLEPMVAYSATVVLGSQQQQHDVKGAVSIFYLLQIAQNLSNPALPNSKPAPTASSWPTGAGTCGSLAKLGVLLRRGLIGQRWAAVLQPCLRFIICTQVLLCKSNPTARHLHSSRWTSTMAQLCRRYTALVLLGYHCHTARTPHLYCGLTAALLRA